MLLEAVDADTARHLQIVEDLNHGRQGIAARLLHSCSDIRPVEVHFFRGLRGSATCLGAFDSAILRSGIT